MTAFIRHGSWALLCLVLVFAISCSKKDDGSQQLPATEGEPNPIIRNQQRPIGEVDPEYFWVFTRNVEDGNSTIVYPDHVAGQDWENAQCQIPVSQKQDEVDMLCIAETPENALYNQGVEFHVNVPEAFDCQFLEVHMYYFFLFSAGFGPSNVSVRRFRDGRLEFADPNNPPAGVVINNNSLYCDHDHTRFSSLGAPGAALYANCCEGNYVLNTLVEQLDGSFVSELTNGSWGGSRSACLAGPAITSPSHAGFDEFGFPKFITVDLSSPESSSTNQTFDMGSSKGPGVRRSNVFLANYYDPSNHNSGIEQGLNKPISFLSNHGYRDTADYYEFRCVDSAREILARIRYMVRDWDTYTEFNRYLNSANHDAGFGGVQSNFSNDPLNDYNDWRDFQNYPGPGI